MRTSPCRARALAGAPARVAATRDVSALTPENAAALDAARLEKTLDEVRKQAAQLANDNWMFAQPRSNLAVLSQLAPPKR